MATGKTYDPRANGALCDLCPLAGMGHGPVPPEGPPGPSPYTVLTFVGDGPGAQEVKMRRPFVGAPGQKLGEMLRALGLERGRVWLTSALLCRAETPGVEGAKRFDLPTYIAFWRKENIRLRKNKEAPVASPLDCCRPRLLGELLGIEEQSKHQPNGAVIVPLGNYAAHAITGRQGLMKLRGSPLPVTIPGLPGCLGQPKGTDNGK